MEQITMAGIAKVFTSICCNTSGATAIEYGFIAMLISVVAVATMNSIGSWTAASFEAVTSGL
jgi:pilus assembly protein Flp/PilA